MVATLAVLASFLMVFPPWLVKVWVVVVLVVGFLHPAV